MTEVPRVIARPEGDWLVVADGRRFAVPDRVARRYANPEDLAVAVASAAGDPARGPGRQQRAHRSSRRALWLRIPVLPAFAVEALAGRLAPLAGWRGLTMAALIGVAAYAVVLSRPLVVDGAVAESASAVTPMTVASALAAFLVTAFWHELGHAAALARSGLPPGRIGAGILFVVPVLFADVSAAVLLARRDRLRVDVAGMCFQLAAGGVMVAVAMSAARWAPGLVLPLRGAGVAALLAVIWSALPFIRADGYWVLCDVFGLQDLDRPIAEARRPDGASDPATHASSLWLVIGLVVYRLLNAAFLGLVGCLVSWRVSRLLSWISGGLIHRAPAESELTWQTLLVRLIVVVIWLSLAGQILRLLRACWRDVRDLVADRPG